MRNLFLVLVLVFLTACGGAPSKSLNDIPDDEKIVFARIMYPQAVLKNGKLTDDNVGITDMIRGGFTGDVVSGDVTICFDIKDEYRTECKTMSSVYLDPKDKYISSQGLIYFPIKSDKLSISRIEIDDYIFEITSMSPTTIDSKFNYIGDLLIVLSKGTKKHHYKLNLKQVNRIMATTKLLDTKKVSFPNKAEIKYKKLNLDKVTYKRKRRVN